MLKVRLMLQRFSSCERGATAIEYALIASVISMVIMVAVNSIGETLNTSFTNIKIAME